MTVIVLTYGYSTFLPGEWSFASFFSYYSESLLLLTLSILYRVQLSTRVYVNSSLIFCVRPAMVGVAPILYIFWKIVKRTPIVRSKKADLVWERPVIDAYEATFDSPPAGFWVEVLQLFHLKRGSSDENRMTVGRGAVQLASV